MFDDLLSEFIDLFRVKDFVKRQAILNELETAKSFLDKVLGDYYSRSIEKEKLYKSALFLLTKSRICMLMISESATGEIENELVENIELREKLLDQAREDILLLSNGFVDIKNINSSNNFTLAIV